MNEKEPRIIVISLRELLIQFGMVALGAALVLHINSSWAQYAYVRCNELYPEAVRFLPFSHWMTTALWIAAGLYETFRAACCFWRHHFFMGTVMLASYSFWGYMLMYFFPGHVLFSGIAIYHLHHNVSKRKKQNRESKGAKEHGVHSAQNDSEDQYLN